VEKFPNIHGIRCGNLHELVSDSLPSNGQWHTLISLVRKKEDGEFQIDELVVRKGYISDATFETGAKYRSNLAEPTEPFPCGDAGA